MKVLYLQSRFRLMESSYVSVGGTGNFDVKFHRFEWKI